MTDPLQPTRVSTGTIIARRRAKRIGGWRPYAAVVLILFGITVIVVELVKYWTQGHSIHPTPVLIGCGFAFVGFFLLDPKESLTGGQFLVNSTVALVGVIRSGRRATDSTVVVVPPEPEEKG